jgi:hypothetical protein
MDLRSVRRLDLDQDLARYGTIDETGHPDIALDRRVGQVDGLGVDPALAG